MHVLKNVFSVYIVFTISSIFAQFKFYKTDFDSIHSKYIQTPNWYYSKIGFGFIFVYDEEIEPVSLTILSIHGTVLYTIHSPYYLNSMNTIEWTGVDINGIKYPQEHIFAYYI